MPELEPTSPLESLIRNQLTSFEPAVVEPFLSSLRSLVGERADAILVYGSCLSSVTRSSTSTPDFFVLVRRYRDFHRSLLHTVVNWILPPSIYHFTVDGRTAKYNVLSFGDLAHDTSPRARDVYQLGRFSKRMGAAWTRDPGGLEEIVAAQAAAMRTVAAQTRHLLPENFTLDTFILEALRLSYYGDVRVEAADKIERLFRSDEEFYRTAYRLILHSWAEERDGAFFKKPAFLRETIGRFTTRIFLSKSRLRAQLRWPKGMFTVENWLDYLIQKIERTQGIRIELTPREKRFWFIYGWKYFIALRRKKLIH
ncbi:MAG: hypothetical protein V1495_08200 [Pseudomonadota bacterium]